MFRTTHACILLTLTVGPAIAGEQPSVSGIYPHLAMFNNEGECGIGAVVPWAGKLWVTTYGPHAPGRSSDKLYEIDNKLSLTVRPESVGGTTGNRLIHKETDQLFIGPYVIDKAGKIKVIPRETLYGRLCGTARHGADPANKIYYGTMEEGFYEVDVHTLAVKELYQDANRAKNRGGDLLPGYHGKGLYFGQGRLIYANNGERTPEAERRPDVASGCLAEWTGGAWRVVRRNQFTEVTGPGGIHGNEKPDSDPVWSIGWDHRSLILMVLDDGRWHSYRLPKASHCYDGAHGWNTEWPRIRDIGEDDRLMTMHGAFWRFPKTFRVGNSAGIAPRSTYLKIIGDIGRWGDRLVLGADDTAKNDFLNTRRARGKLTGPGQSQSNLWFIQPKTLDQLGVPLGRGAVWLDEPVKAGEPSEPYLFAGYDRRILHLAHRAEGDVTFSLEVDRKGNNTWQPLRDVTAPARGASWIEFTEKEAGAWVRIKSNRDCPKATALFHYANNDRRGADADAIFAGLARPGDTKASGALLRARGENKRTLHLVAFRPEDGGPRDVGYYEMGADLKLQRVDDPKSQTWLKENAAVPQGVITIDDASVLFVDDAGKRWRLPQGDACFDAPGPFGPERIDREVCTERDLFNCHGTFYELPAENAGGFAKVRPIATHNRRIMDYCSYRGLLVLSGVSDNAASSPHIVRSDDGRCAVWVGAVDDLWKLGKPRGKGGPWKNTAVKANLPSDPYLLTGYDKKSLVLRHDAAEPVKILVEVDVSGTGLWLPYQTFDVPAGMGVEHSLSNRSMAYWLRVTADRNCHATAQLTYE